MSICFNQSAVMPFTHVYMRLPNCLDHASFYKNFSEKLTLGNNSPSKMWSDNAANCMIFQNM